MQIKYLKSVIEAKGIESKIIAVSWAPNNQKLAVATSDRQVLVFDASGEQRDRFATKPADAQAGKRSYVIKGIAFSPDSTRIAVAQSDSIVYVYKIGDQWGERKAISNKFPQPMPVTCATWLSSGPIVCGLLDGKVRLLQTKSNKSHSLYSSDSLVVALAANASGSGFVSGHADGSIIRFYTNEQTADAPAGRLCTHSVPPYALAWPQGSAVFAAGCDRRIVVYNSNGRIAKQFDAEESELTTACCSPSGQAVAIGGYDKVRLFAWNSGAALWEETQTKSIPHMGSVTSLAWARDGSRIACASHCGFMCLFESVLRRTVWKDRLEITYVGPSQVLVRRLDDVHAGGLILQSASGGEIDDLRVMGREGFIVARTAGSLLVGDATRGRMSEVAWSGAGRRERFYFDTPGVCLAFSGGELSLIEYGVDGVLATVRTEFANPHLVSVRLGAASRRLAYLLDLKTVVVVDVARNAAVCQVAHEAKLDWLELSATGHKLLFRDAKQRLFLVDVAAGSRTCLLSGVAFAAWVEGSDVALAQAGDALAVWYNIDLPDRPTMLSVRGEVRDVVRHAGRTQVHAVDGEATLTLDLDEALLEFATAVHDSDLGRAVLFLEAIGDAPEADAMWWSLTALARSRQDVALLGRCYAALGNVAKAFCAQQVAEQLEREGAHSRAAWAHMAVLDGDLQTAERIHLEQGDVAGALAMYTRLHKWDEAIALAEQRGYAQIGELRDERMRLLLQTGRFEQAGSILEAGGEHERALSLYLKANKVVRAAGTLLAQRTLLADANLVARVLQQLVQHELFEHAADVYAALDKPPMAMECYRKGKAWSKAVELARAISPERVVALEEEWGDHLVAGKQADAAISHYIEAGCTLKALDAAISARQWRKAVHIVQAVEAHDSLTSYCSTLGEHLARAKEYATAEAMFVKARMYREAAQMYNAAGQWAHAHRIASQHLDADEVADMCLRQAEQLEAAGRYRDAEKLYVAVNAPDLAIAMHRRVEQFDSMVRLVERFHPELLASTHSHLAQQMDAQGKRRAAEVHHLAAGDWRAAMAMYRGGGMWEDAYRVAKQHGGAAPANQVAFLWARALPADSAVKLLAKLGALEACVDHACETGQHEFAFQLCRGLPAKTADVHYSCAMALEDAGNFEEAEAAFVRAGRPKEAVLMYTHASDWQSALRVAEAHEPNAVGDVLRAHAMQRFQEKAFADFEALLLRAQAPDLIVASYRSAGMWTEALRVCKDYLPSQLQSLQAECATIQRPAGSSDLASIEAVLTRANELAQSGQHRQSIECLMQVNAQIADEDIEKRALARAADMVHRFLYGSEADGLIRDLAPRLRDLGEWLAAAKLFISADLVQEAVDCFILAEDWSNARKIARELDPQLVDYVERKHRDRLAKEGNIEQLADVDIMGALELLAEQGQWLRCIEKAKLFGGNVLQKYVAQYASVLLRDALTIEALDLFITHATPATPQNFNIYNRIAFNMFAMPNLADAESYGAWSRLRRMLLDLVNGLQLTAHIDAKVRAHFETLLLIAHLYAVRCVCRQVQVLKALGAMISAALLRYTDIIPADKAFYEAGVDLRSEGRTSEAFVFLNHYLDVCEAIEDEESQLIDHTELGRTDFPANVPIPERLHLHDERDEHDRVREWVLAVSMDQQVGQELPLDARMLYESSLESGQRACILTGYPLRSPAVTFVHAPYAANKDAWTKLAMAGKMYPDSHIADLLSFIHEWCGTATAL